MIQILYALGWSLVAFLASFLFLSNSGEMQMTVNYHAVNAYLVIPLVIAIVTFFSNLLLRLISQIF